MCKFSRILKSAIGHPPDRVVAGTGGLRKMRFAPPSRRTGKSGAFRVIYGYFPQFAHVYLILIYGKNEQDNLTADEKSACRGLIAEIIALLKSTYGVDDGH